jgi:hypothetical protein
MLLRRQNQSPQDFGLEEAAISGPIGPEHYEHLGLKIYRGTKAQREAVIAWWGKQKSAEAKARSG